MEFLKSESMRGTVLRIVMSLLVTVAIAIGGTMLSFKGMSEKLDTRTALLESQVLDKQLPTRMAAIEVQIEKHEQTIEKDFGRHEQTVQNLSHKTDDQEKRLTRLETLVGETQKVLDEIRTDVKILLRGGQQ